MKLTVDEVIALFDSPKDMMAKLGIKHKQQITNMKANGYIPASHAITIHRLGLADIEDVPVKINQLPLGV